jgi:hypothetical protein
MLGFLKKMFGFDEKTLNDAGVQIEQAPYKVSEPVVPTPVPLVVETAPVVVPVVTEKPAAKRKPQGQKQPQGQKSVTKSAPAKTGNKPRGRRPKSKPQA